MFFGQSVPAQYAIDASGGSVKNSNYFAYYSIGEIVSATIKGSPTGSVSTCGVIQPDPIIVTGVDHPVLKIKRVYPNPVSDFLRVHIESNESIIYSVFSIEGILLNKSKLVHNSIDLQGLQAGIYFLEFELGESHSKQTFIISKI